jgi:glutamyl-tRNA(Gln) amidotransferase subunit E
MVHSDDADTGVRRGTWRDIRTSVGAGLGDVVVLVWAPPPDGETAAREVLLRAQAALEGVPAETRQAHADGTTGFERILPGADRMYPDTDTPPLPIPGSTVASIRATLPEHPVAREDRYRDLGLPGLLARRLARSPWAGLFDEAVPTDGDCVGRLAWFMVDRMAHHARRAGSLPVCDASRLRAVVEAVTGGSVRPEALTRMLDAAVAEPDTTPAQIVDRFRRVDDADDLLRATVEKSARRAQALEGRTPDTRLRWAMGDAMRVLLGRVDPGAVRTHLAAALGVAQAGARP